MDRKLGVCYYPEHWPEQVWAEDAARMKKAGLSLVRIGEFAWSRIEPKPDQFDFGWLDRAVDILGKAGLGIVMCTPTATPPRWMIRKYPDMTAVDANGNPRKFGSRRHYCFSHQGYGEECRRITRIIAERYGKNPQIVAWQTDNEYGCHDTTLSYSVAARQGFVDWLSARYATIDKLNAAWGNVFWSMEYGFFHEVDLPNQTVTEPNPAHCMDFARYSSDRVAVFNKAQVDILRDLSPGRPIIHNYMGGITDFDHFAVGADLDIASWDSYPLGFLSDRIKGDSNHKARFLRQGDPDYQAFHHDLYRSVGKGRWWVMEQQPGPVNWAPYNPAPLDGMARLWAWEAFAHGAEAVCYFRWRQAPFGQEQMHTGLLRPDSTSANGLIQAARVAEELPCAPQTDSGPSDVALIFDYESAWAWRIQPQGQEFDYISLVLDNYRALRRLGLSVDILPAATTDLSAYAVTVIPGLMYWSSTLREALTNYKGIACIGPRSGSKTNAFSIPNDLPPDLSGLLDLVVNHTESLPSQSPVDLESGGAFKSWREIVAPGDTAQVLERTCDGHPALLAQDNLRYCAGWADQTGMFRFLCDACIEAGLSVLDLPVGLRVRDTADHRFVFNYDKEAIDPALHGLKGDFLLGAYPLDAGEVAILKRR